MSSIKIYAGLLCMALLIIAVPLAAKDKKGGSKGSASSDCQLVMGAIDEIDAAAGTLTVGEKKLKVAEKCSFQPGGKVENATLASFKKGDKVLVTAKSENGELLATIIAIQSGEKGAKKKKK